MAILEEHSRHAANRTTTRPRSLLLVVVSIGLAILVAGMIVGTRGRFAKLFTEFDLPLSPVTSFALGPVLPILLATIAALTLAKEPIPRFKSIANAWNGSVACVALASLALYLVGVFAALLALIDGLS